MRKVVNFCDYFIICTASSDRRIKSVGEAIEDGLYKVGIKLHHTKGNVLSNNWVVMDVGDIVIHIFDVQTREFYGLEHLWQDAKKVSWT